MPQTRDETGRSLLAAIEAGGTKFVCAVREVGGETLARTVVPTGAPEETSAACLGFFKEAAGARRYAGLGVAAFGPVGTTPDASDYGVVGPTPKPGWAGFDYKQAFATLGAPLTLDTDVGAAALAEAEAWKAGPDEPIAYVTVGTGIGGGVAKGEAILRGVGQYEMGHLYPPHDQAKDPFDGVCPFHGDCLEGLASGPAIEKRWGKPLSDLPANHPGHDLIATYLAHLGVAIVLTHRPRRIVWGGGVMKTPGLLDRLRRRTGALLGGYVSDIGEASVGDVLLAPTLGDGAGIEGAFRLAERGAEASNPND